MNLIKNIIKKLCFKLYGFAIQHREEQLKKRFNILSTVSIYNVSLEGNVEIGECTYVNENSRIDSGENSKVIIGRHCAIGRFVHITSKTHDLTCPTSDELHQEAMHQEANVIIGDNVWIGDYVIILPGVTVGNYAIIGAHSLVKANVESFEVVGGVPATHLKFNTGHYLYSTRKE